MASHARIRPPGFWVLTSVVDPTEFEALDAAQVDSISASGQSVANAAPLAWGGAGHQFVTCPFSGTLDITAGLHFAGVGIVKFDAGSTLVMDAAATGYVAGIWHSQSGSAHYYDAGGSLHIFGTQTIESGGAFTAAAGSTVSLAGTTNVPTGGSFTCSAGSTFGVSGTNAIDGSLLLTAHTTRTGATARMGDRGMGALADATPQTVDTTKDVWRIPTTLSQDTTLNVSAGIEEGNEILIFRSNATGGSHIITINCAGAGSFSYTWPSGVNPYWIRLKWLAGDWYSIGNSNGVGGVHALT